MNRVEKLLLVFFIFSVAGLVTRILAGEPFAIFVLLSVLCGLGFIYMDEEGENNGNS